MKKAQAGRIVGKAVKRFLKSPTKTTVARSTSEGIQRSKKPKAQYGIETKGSDKQAGRVGQAIGAATAGAIGAIGLGMNRKKRKEERSLRDANIKEQNRKKVEEENRGSTVKELEGMGMKRGGNIKKKMQSGGTTKKASKVTVDKPYERGITGQGNSATKTSSTMSGGTKTKKVSTGAVFPGAKGSVTKTKTDSKGNMIKTSSKTVSKSKAGKMINRMSK
jgi:hypothetical protein